MTYLLKIHREVEKQLQRIPKKPRTRLVETMRALSAEPRPRGSEKLDEDLYRIRQGDYRIIYAIFEKEVVIVICAENPYRGRIQTSSSHNAAG